VTTIPLLTLELRYERDVVLARQRGRQIARLLGFDAQDQTRIATAISELARNAFEYAGGGKVSFAIERELGGEQLFVAQVRDDGPGIKDVQAILDGRYHSSTGMGLGILGARRLTERF
jgi:anti-sigma regulatory factor (Ser/Thr protein kinase)